MKEVPTSVYTLYESHSFGLEDFSYAKETNNFTICYLLGCFTVYDV